MASTNNYINEYATLDEMNAAYESDHSGSWVSYCAEDNNLYYQQKTTISSKYFDNLEYNSENKTLDFYIDGKVKKSIDVSPWWFEKESYYTREEVNNKINNLTLPYSSITSTPTTLSGYGITNAIVEAYPKINIMGGHVQYAAFNNGGEYIDAHLVAHIDFTGDKFCARFTKLASSDKNTHQFTEFLVTSSWHGTFGIGLLRSDRGTNNGIFCVKTGDYTYDLYDDMDESQPEFWICEEASFYYPDNHVEFLDTFEKVDRSTLTISHTLDSYIF